MREVAKWTSKPFLTSYMQLFYNSSTFRQQMWLNGDRNKIIVTVRSTTLFELCVRGNGSASAMCGQISPLGVFIRFGTMQVAGCRSGLALGGGFGWLAGSSFADDPVLQPLNPRAVHSHYANLHYVAFCVPQNSTTS